MGNKLRAQHIGRWVGAIFFFVEHDSRRPLRILVSRAQREREREREERKTAIIFWACAIFVHDAPHPRLKHGGGLTSENGGAQRKENTLITVVRKTALCLACNNAHKLLFLETFYPFPLFRYFQGVLTDSSEGEGSEYSYLPEKTCCEEKMIKISIFIFLPDVLP